MGDKSFVDISAARMNTKPIGSIAYGDSRKFSISDSSPILEVDGSKGRYEVFQVPGIQGQSYFISVIAVCNCLGFRKQSLVPIIYLLDKNGAVLQRGIQIHQTAQYVTGKFPRNDEYYVLIVADAAKEGRPVGKLQGDSVIPAGFAVEATNTGSAFINWEKK